MVRKKQADAEGTPIKSHEWPAGHTLKTTKEGGEGMAGNVQRGPTMTKEIGGTTYIVTSEYSENATETAEKKMRRLILKEAEKVIKECK